MVCSGFLGLGPDSVSDELDEEESELESESESRLISAAKALCVDLILSLLDLRGLGSAPTALLGPGCLFATCFSRRLREVKDLSQ